MITEKKLTFEIEDLKFFLPKSFKGLSQEYILDCIFNDKIQSKWKPQVGDLIVGGTGNVFVISGKHFISIGYTHDGEPIEGDSLFFYADGLCNRDGGGILDDTHCSVMNESGNAPEAIKDKLNCHSWKEFKFVPYPHENDRM